MWPMSGDGRETRQFRAVPDLPKTRAVTPRVVADASAALMGARLMA